MVQGGGAAVPPEAAVSGGQRLHRRRDVREYVSVAALQSSSEIEMIFRDHLIGRSIRAFQVVGVNSLKTVNPPANVLAGASIVRANVDTPAIEIVTNDYSVRIDLARTGRVTWLDQAVEWSPADGTPAPTLRLLLEGGGALDFREPAKTKRITAFISDAA